MRRADAAMYEAKSGGRDMVCYFSPETDQRVLAQLMETQLPRRWRRAVQPALPAPPECPPRQLGGAEAWIRWHNPVVGGVPPGDFIGWPKETGLINAIGLWLLEETCGHWVQLSPQPAAVPEPAQAEQAWQLSVNLSAAQLADPLLVAEVRDVLACSGLPPPAWAGNHRIPPDGQCPTFAQEQVAALKQLGVRVAIDDFGTRLLQPGLPQAVPDRQAQGGPVVCARHARRHRRCRHRAGTVIALGHTLGLAVVAEGVETMPTAHP